MFRSFAFAFVLAVATGVAEAQTGGAPQGGTPALPPVAPAGGSAQQPQAVAPLPPVAAGAPPAGTAPAFVIQSDNGDNRVQLGALLQIDGRFALDDEQHNVVDSLNVRRFRAITQGRVTSF